MSNNTTLNVMDANYNLTKILNVDIVNNPNDWVLAFNNEFSGYFFITLLVVIGVVIYITMKSSGTVQTDSEALSFAGIVCTFAGIIMLVLGLVEWLYLIPIFVVTAIAVYLNFTARQF